MHRFVLVVTLLATTAAAQTSLVFERVATGLSNPLFLTHAPGDTARVFILEQGSAGTARIKTLDLTTSAVSTYLTLTGLRTGGEEGLLGLAFHPDFATNGHLYVYVSTSVGGRRSEVRRYTAVGDPLTSTSADLASMLPILDFSQPFFNHNGGWMDFGPNDGYLYISSGDGGSGGDPQGNGQDITNEKLGKMLRIDVNADDFPSDASRNYAIPPTNPFVNVTGDDEIWAYGLRNPWRCSFDTATGDLYIGDVGQNAREEINFQPADSAGGENYGWRCREGSISFDNSCNPPDAVSPVYDYLRNFGSFGGFSVTGGYVYRGCKIPELEGVYIFGDFVTNNIWSFQYWAGQLLDLTSRNIPTNISSINGLASFGTDATGELYAVSYDNGQIFRLAATNIPDGCERCNTADLALPYAVLDIFDLLEYLARFDAASPAADIAPPVGTWDTFDIIEYLNRFDEGCR